MLSIDEIVRGFGLFAIVMMLYFIVRAIAELDYWKKRENKKHRKWAGLDKDK